MNSIAKKNNSMKPFKQLWQEKEMNCRLGTTSFVIPGEIISNLKYLKDIVENVEVILFESEGFSNIPTTSDILEMGIIARDSGLTFTIHLPRYGCACNPDRGNMEKSLEKWLRVIDLLEALSPLGWIVHLEDSPGLNPPRDSWPSRDGWMDQCGKAIDKLCNRIEPDLLCVKTLNTGFNRLRSLVDEKKCSICLDIGHLQSTGHDVAGWLDECLAISRIIHLHGVRDDGRENLDLGYLETGLLDDLVTGLKMDSNFSRILTLEVFSRKDLEKSMNVLNSVI